MFLCFTPKLVCSVLINFKVFLCLTNHTVLWKYSPVSRQDHVWNKRQDAVTYKCAVVNNILNLAPSVLMNNWTPPWYPLHTQSRCYQLSPMNLFTCGTFQTGVFWAFQNFPNTLLPLSNLSETCCCNQTVIKLLLLYYSPAGKTVKTEEDTVDHTREHPGFGHRDGGKIQIPCCSP